jgi:uncharacterized protein (DUF2126 family)
MSPILHNRPQHRPTFPSAQVSVLPPTPQERKHPRADLTLQAVSYLNIWHTLTRSISGCAAHSAGFCRRNVDANPRSGLHAEFRTAGRPETQQAGGHHYQSHGTGNRVTGDIPKPNVAPQEAS